MAIVLHHHASPIIGHALERDMWLDSFDLTIIVPRHNANPKLGHIQQTTTVNYTRSLPDFTPVQSTLPSAALVPVLVGSRRVKRSDTEGLLLRRQDNGTEALPPPDPAVSVYSQSVTCITEINIYLNFCST